MSTNLGISDLAAAIEREENVNPAYNNPGAIMSNGSLNQYSTLDEGQTALNNLLQNAVSGNSKYYNPNMSLEQFEQTYTGGDTNAGSNVASFLGVPSSTPIGSFSGTNSAAQSSTGTTTQPATTNASSTATTWLNTAQSLLGIPSGSDFAGIIAIIVGIILVAGAVFGFRQLTTTVVEGAKRGAELSA